MLRILTVAAVAALVAAPASAQSIRIATAGKTPEQLQVEVVKAAKAVCARATMGASFPREMMKTCMEASLAHALAQPAAAKLAGAPAQLAAR